MNRYARLLPLALLLVATVLVLRPQPAAAQQDTDYQTPPPALAKLVDAPQTPRVSLSPDRTRMLLMQPQNLPSIAELAAPELRLAGLRINPRNNGPSRSGHYTSLTLRTLEGGPEDSAERPVTGLPENPRIRNVEWSPDGEHIAFTVDREDHIDLYAAGVDDARARRLTSRAVNDAFYGDPFEWQPDSRAVLARLVPEGRGDMPEAPRVPEGPVTEEHTGGEEAPARTYQDLLENEHDAALFEHYTTSELVRVPLEGEAETVGAPALYTQAEPSPNGEYILTEAVHRPFSYLVPAYRFPQRIAVLDRSGALVKEIADLPLAENVPVAFGSVREGVRSAQWRADAPATLAWTEALDEGDAGKEAEERDQVYLLEAPFEAEPTPLATLPLRYSGIRWGDDDLALVTEYWFANRKARVYAVDPSDPGAEPEVLFDYSYEDRYNDPGSPAMEPTENGTYVLTMTDDRDLFLMGDGASPEGDRPFLRLLDPATGETEELFRSEAPYYEDPVTLLNTEERVLLTRRESKTEPPNYFRRDLPEGTMAQLTDFPHPYPELKDIQKELVTYEREDGVQLSATLYLPAGYDAERDDPLPGLVWAYPREYKSADAAGQVSGSPHRFKRLSYWGAVPFVTQGYAVMDDAAMPVIGEGETEPNDTFREQLVAGARAAIEEGARRGVLDPDRVGVAGHSYGAFMVGNLLAHSDLFDAGIARSGAYNRSLTPFGFQREERTFWEAPEIYFEMSPFMHVDDVNEPLLLIHGQEDNNSGTYPMQSERYYNALKGLGKTARLVMLPHESHGYRARESVLHMLWEMDRWLDRYVKNAEATASSDGHREDTSGE